MTDKLAQSYTGESDFSTRHLQVLAFPDGMKPIKRD
jgi:hypothetical protein